MTRRERPRCGKWMPRAGIHCPLPLNHAGRCRTPQGMKANYGSSATRLRQITEERYLWMDAYKLELGCQRCGYKEDPRALDWDHTDPSTKVGNVSRLIRYASMTVLMREIAKCTLLCANCHRIKTFQVRRRPSPEQPFEEGPCDEITDGSPPR